jgi:hypothetical protein
MQAQLESGVAAPYEPEPGTPMIHLQAREHDHYGYHPYKPMVDALAIAQERGVPVALTVARTDGSVHFYQANPNGVLTANDRGFAEAFSTLHPSLARMAEGRVDLHDLYYRHRGAGAFTHDVAGALRHAGVEPAIVAEAAHSIVPSHAPKHLRGEPGTAHDDGGRPTVGSTYSPGAAGQGGLSV